MKISDSWQCLMVVYENFLSKARVENNFVKSYHTERNDPQWNITFSEFSEFRECDKSLKHELGSI